MIQDLYIGRLGMMPPFSPIANMLAKHLSFCLSFILPEAAFADDPRYWLLQQNSEQIGQSCPEGVGCSTHSSYVVRSFPHGSESLVQPLIALLDPAGQAGADVPVFCAAGDSAARLGFDPESVPPAHKLAALKGLTAIGLDLRKTKPPPGAVADFGDILHNAFAEKLQAAGLLVVTPEVAKTLPGQPSFNVYFSFTEGYGDCNYRYSIFASLSQTALLTRDLQTKVVVGVWSISVKTPSQDASGTEMANLIGVAEALVVDFQQANSR